MSTIHSAQVCDTYVRFDSETNKRTRDDLFNENGGKKRHTGVGFHDWFTREKASRSRPSSDDDLYPVVYKRQHREEFDQKALYTRVGFHGCVAREKASHSRPWSDDDLDPVVHKRQNRDQLDLEAPYERVDDHFDKEQR
jgi:hypothetical protein